MISEKKEEEYERNKIQWRMHTHMSRCWLQPYGEDALVSFWQQDISAGEIRMEMCPSSDSREGVSEGDSGSLQIWGLLKYVKRSWWLLGPTGDGNLPSGNPQWVRAGGTAWHMHWALVVVLDLCHQPCGVVAQGRCGVQQGLCGSALLKGHLLGQGALSLLCLMWQR